MKIDKLNLDEFVEAVVSEESQSTIIGGYLDIRPYLNGGYAVLVTGSGPYTTYIDGVWADDDDQW